MTNTCCNYSRRHPRHRHPRQHHHHHHQQQQQQQRRRCYQRTRRIHSIYSTSYRPCSDPHSAVSTLSVYITSVSLSKCLHCLSVHRLLPSCCTVHSCVGQSVSAGLRRMHVLKSSPVNRVHRVIVRTYGDRTAVLCLLARNCGTVFDPVHIRETHINVEQFKRLLKTFLFRC